MKNIYTTLLLIIAFNIGTAQSWEWLNTAGGNIEGWGLVSTIDDNDNIIYGGSFTTDTMFVGNDTLLNPWAPNPVGFIIKVNSTGALIWSKSLSESFNLSFVDISGIGTDGFGNVYVTGSFGCCETNLEIGNGITLGTAENSAMFIVKYSPGGFPIWAHDNQRTMGSMMTDCKGRSIVVDNLGYSYVGGVITGDTATVGQFEIPNTNPNTFESDAFIVKFSPNGTPINSFSTGLFTNEGSHLALTPQGNVVFATQFHNDTAFIGTDTLINKSFGNGTKDGIVIKFNPNLGPLWARSFGSEDEDEITDVEVDNLGNIYATGGIQGLQISFAGVDIDNTSLFRGVVVKFDNLGNELASITTPTPTGSEKSFFTNIDIVNHDEIYVSCIYDDAVQLGSSSLPDPGFFSSYVARVDSSGDALWMYTSSSAAPTPTDSIMYQTLEHDQDGNIYVGGWYAAGDIGFGGGIFANNTLTGLYDVFMAKLSNTCNLEISFTNTPSTCGQNTGESTANVTGGSGNYDYQWTSGDSTVTAGNLNAGMYQLVVTDTITGCEISGMAMISDNGGATINLVGTGSNQVTCPGGNDGQILINLVGGQTPRTISWSTGDTTLLINNLTAGPYDVTVEDGNGCITTQSLNLTEPDAFNLSYTTTDASCGFADGEANVHVEGGTSPYTYSWAPGTGTDTTATGLGVGDYTFMVTDVNGCSESIIVMVNEANGPIITIDSVLTASCLNGNGGSVYISISGQPGPYTYQWSNGGGTNEDLVGVTPGNYAVMVTAGNGCSSMTSGPVTEELPEPQSVCMVTVDTITGYNLVVWEKPIVGHISHYNIYQEQTQAGVFNYVGSNPYASESQFVDSLANPMIRSYRYKISSVDTCGVESELSWEHKTIHMVMSTFGGDNYISWDNYEGFTYASFEVWKYSDQTGWSILYTLPSNLNSCTDPAPTGTNINYYIAAVPNEICSATKAQDHNTTRSNRHTALESSPNAITELDNVFVSLFPNPTNDIFKVELSNGLVNNWSVEVYDISGKTISYNRGLSDNYHIVDLKDAEVGIYLVRIQVGSKMVFRKVVKQ